MKLPLRRPIAEVADECSISIEIILRFIEEEWIVPIDVEENMLDEEDVCRLLLIHDLKNKFEVNDEAVPVILHLVDQLNFIIHQPENGPEDGPEDGPAD